MLETSPCFAHLQTDLKDNRGASQRLFENNVPSALLEITVVPLAFIHPVQMCTMCTESSVRVQKPRIVSHYTNAHYLLGITASLTRLMQSYR
ncbi:hypothetical protein QQF64_027937 [Cirrhinus molitorella]|uniref:Uncharacterized protein n=1 Tax=Cirrhinus molitorella TaxID=172907 RepID=A0ABR3NEI3_9TELE